MLYLSIGNGGLTYRTPVDNTGALVNPIFRIQLNKDILYRFRAAFIHRKTLSLPVCGRTELAKLFYNPSAVLISPLPALLQKFLSGKVGLFNSLLL